MYVYTGVKQLHHSIHESFMCRKCYGFVFARGQLPATSALFWLAPLWRTHVQSYIVWGRQPEWPLSIHCINEWDTYPYTNSWIVTLFECKMVVCEVFLFSFVKINIKFVLTAIHSTWSLLFYYMQLHPWALKHTLDFRYNKVSDMCVCLPPCHGRCSPCNNTHTQDPT